MSNTRPFSASLLLPACSSVSHTEGSYLLYFPNASYLETTALGTQPVDLSEELPAEEALICALLAGPSDTNLVSPFPKNVTLRSWYVRDEVLHINLSEQYGGLSGITLTLADCSITLTLCQLEHIKGVSITVENDPIPFRYRQILTPQDILLPTAAPGS